MSIGFTKVVADFRRLSLAIFWAKVVARCRRFWRDRVLRLQGRFGGLGIGEARFQRHLRRQRISRASWGEVFGDHLRAVSLLDLSRGRPSPGLSAAFREKLVAGDRARAQVFDLLGSGHVKVGWSPASAGRDGHRYEIKRSTEADAALLSKLRSWLPSDFDYEPIDWHIDFISGYRWAADAWFADIPIGGVPGADIRVPWELGRCYHFVTLAQCWALSRDRVYTEEIVAQIYDFVLSNPVGFGPNWVSPMDVAIRVSNWLVALPAVAKAGGLDADRASFIARAVYDHARFIENNLEWSAEVNGNHYTANLVGLYFVGVCCPHLPRARRWRDFAQRELEREIVTQVYEDGCNFEGSTLYHRLVLELFLYSAVLGRRSGREFSPNYEAKVAAMCRVVRELCFRTGEIAQVGDNDSARFIAMDSLPLASLRVDHYLPIADWFFEQPVAGYPRDVDQSPLWWFGGATVAGVPVWAERRSVVFRDAGWTMLRRGDWECLVSCGPNGQGGNGGHGHNDKLGVSIVFAGIPLVVDPGTYLYTADPHARNRYRSTAFHSTPQLDALEQNSLPEQLFSLPDTSRATIREVDEHSFVGTHESFGHPVQLRLHLAEDGAHFVYEVGPGRYTMRWLLHPDVEARVESAGTVLRVGSHAFCLTASSGEVVVGEYRFSPAYGRATPAAVVTTTFVSSVSCHLVRV